MRERLMDYLKGITSLRGYRVAVMDDIKKNMPEMVTEGGQLDSKYFEENIRPKYPIQIRQDKESISFSLEYCDEEAMLAALIVILLGRRKKSRCINTEMALTHLETALQWIRGCGEIYSKTAETE